MHTNIIKNLDDLNIPYVNHTHKALHTVDQAKEFDTSINATPTKNLFLKDKKKNYYLITCYAYANVNLKDISKKIQARGSLSFVNEDTMLLMLNLKPGNVTPFGLIYAKSNNFDINFYLDEDLIKKETIGIHPLRNDMTTVLKVADLQILLSTHNIISNKVIID